MNKMCLAANIPLIESGTSGYAGQVQPIKGDVTECFDCVCESAAGLLRGQRAEWLTTLPLRSQASAEDVRGVHNQEHAVDGSSLHCVGKVVPLPVSADLMTTRASRR